MGLLGGLFQKEACCICGGKTGMLDKKTADGKQVSYDPPHLVYMYNFTLRIQTDHPYIKRIYIPLNKEAVQIKNVGPRIWTDPGRKLAAWVTGLPTLVKEEQAAVYDNESLLHSFFRSKYEMPDSSYGFRCTIENWDDIQKYQYYLFAAREIEQCLTKAPAADSASAGCGEMKYAFEPVDPEEIRGVTFQGRTYKRIGYEWTEYIAQIEEGKAVSIGIVKADISEGTAGDRILNSIQFK